MYNVYAFQYERFHVNICMICISPVANLHTDTEVRSQPYQIAKMGQGQTEAVHRSMEFYG